MKTTKEIALENNERHNKLVADEFLSAVRPIYVVPRGQDAPIAIGSSTLLKVNDASFLLTAAHVADEAKEGALLVGGSVERSLVRLEGQFFSTTAPAGVREKDHYDFSFLRLSTEQVAALGSDVRFIAHTDVSQNRGTLPGRRFLMLGYPVSKNKKSVSRPKRAIKPALSSYQGFHLEAPDLLKKLGLSGVDHLTIKHEARSALFDGTTDNSIHPRGNSGGPLIDFGLPNPAELAPGAVLPKGRLSGLFIERYKEYDVLLFVKIQCVIEQILRATQESS